ncbi:MAG: hypothetical protein ABSF41_03765 [Pseudolabrys sp.]|jgi:hypothetical protein
MLSTYTKREDTRSARPSERTAPGRHRRTTPTDREFDGFYIDFSPRILILIKFFGNKAGEIAGRVCPDILMQRNAALPIYCKV